METIISAVISGGLALIGVIVTVNKGNQKIVAELKAEQAKAQAVTDVRLDELTREVREHNNFAKRMPVVEQKIESIDEKMRILHPDEL
jgi:hypothetical protein